jgi:integrase
MRLDLEYAQGRKISRYRALRGLTASLQAARDYFGRQLLRSITYGDLAAYRALRLKTPVVILKKENKKRKSPKKEVTRQRSITTVNREMALLRRMLNIAEREGWIPRNPFRAGEPLINVADERKRERVISREEEEMLLAACAGPRAHLRPIIICAVDTGMRQGEIFQLKWRDIDLEGRLITIEATTTKTLKSRTVPITERLARELAALRASAPPDPSGKVFGIESNVKRSFTAARRVAGLTDVRFHDLRHTAATRLVQGHLPLAEVARVLGHQQLNTTYRYANADHSTMSRAAAILEAYAAESEPPEVELIN